MRVNEPKKMGFVEQPQPTSLLDFLSISYVITNGTENLSDFISVFVPINITLQNETAGDFFILRVIPCF
jgi:hypothetical protein